MIKKERLQSENTSEMLFDKLIWTVKEVAKCLDVSIGHIYNMKQRDEIPYRKIRGKLRFVPQEIYDWVLSGGF